MGLFSSHKPHHTHQRPEPDYCKVFVFARASGVVPEHGEGSIEPEIQWSVAIESPKHRRSSQQTSVIKRRTSFFGALRKSSKSETSSAEAEDTSVPLQSTVTEFSLDDGNLHVSRLQPATNYRRDSEHSNPSEHSSILLKIRIRHHPQTLPGNQTLAIKIEQILRQVTSTNSNLTNAQSEIWIKYGLVSLQHATILPHGHALNINNLINFAQNKTTEFEAEIMSSSTHLGGDNDRTVELVKELDYQMHLDENARLRALFGHQLPETFEDDDDNSRPTSSAQFTDSTRRSSRDWTHGGMWTARPQGTRVRVYQDDRGVDPYGGLM